MIVYHSVSENASIFLPGSEIRLQSACSPERLHGGVIDLQAGKGGEIRGKLRHKLPERARKEFRIQCGLLGGEDSVHFQRAPARKHGKRADGRTDIRPAIYSISVAPGAGALELEAVLSAQEPTLNPELLPGALGQLAPELRPDFAAFTRLEIYDADMRPFR